jgi:hypothetical protein
MVGGVAYLSGRACREVWKPHPKMSRFVRGTVDVLRTPFDVAHQMLDVVGLSKRSRNALREPVGELLNDDAEEHA